jgi:hypothetical protein
MSYKFMPDGISMKDCFFSEKRADKALIREQQTAGLPLPLAYLSGNGDMRFIQLSLSSQFTMELQQKA